ncbi:MAG: hypothetical protein PHO64_13870 [Thiomonas sp.]|nr:hypothetical protein [Thiomonas sp.]
MDTSRFPRFDFSPAARGLCLLLASLCLGQTASAQAQSAAPSAPLADTQPHEKYPEPLVRNNVTQSPSVRIQEQQVRGATTSIHVQPLHGGAAYNVVPPSVSSSTDPARLEGQAQWKVLTFK